jgi:hypothetical protein
MLKKAVLFVFGFLIGIVLDMVPHVIETLINTNVCRESCGALLGKISIATYVAMPIAWGIIISITIRNPQAKRIVITSTFFSLALMLLLTWFLYKKQHP